MYKFFFIALFLCSNLFATIIQSKKMAEILPKVTPETIVIFDIDNTLLESAQMLGSDMWFEHRIHEYLNLGNPPEEAVSKASRDWTEVSESAKVQLIEKETPPLIEKLQRQGIPTMALTARKLSLMERSLGQLEENGISLKEKTLSSESVSVKDADDALFQKGIFTVGTNNKGKILVALFKKLNLTPKRIVFVDDKQKNVENVDAALTEAGIEIFAFRYGAADKKVKAFEPKLASAQYDFFKKNSRILSDEEMREKMACGNALEKTLRAPRAASHKKK